MTEEKDMFDFYDELPNEVKEVIDNFKENTYDECAKLVMNLNQIGWTCNYYLDAEPYGLRKLQY